MKKKQAKRIAGLLKELARLDLSASDQATIDGIESRLFDILDAYTTLGRLEGGEVN